MMTITMTAQVEAYLAERTTLGFLGAGPNASQLRSFARFFDGSGHRSSLTSDLAIEWAKGHARSREPRAWARRLDTLRPFRSEEHTSELQSLMRISYDVFCLKKTQ